MECKILRTYKNFDKPSLKVISEVINSIENHKLFKHNFFREYNSGNLPDIKEQKWLKQRHFLSKSFPALYANIISNSTDFEFLKPFVRQLWEEFGHGNKSKIHYYQLLNTIYAKGISNCELNNELIQPGTQGIINTYMKWTKHENVVIAGGIFGIAIEPIIAMDMELSLEGLKKKSGLSEHDLTYFKDHATHDYGHSWEILDVVLPKIRSVDEVENIIKGVNEILNSRLKFYDDCYS